MSVITWSFDVSHPPIIEHPQTSVALENVLEVLQWQTGSPVLWLNQYGSCCNHASYLPFYLLVFSIAWHAIVDSLCIPFQTRTVLVFGGILGEGILCRWSGFWTFRIQQGHVNLLSPPPPAAVTTPISTSHMAHKHHRALLYNACDVSNLSPASCPRNFDFSGHSWNFMAAIQIWSSFT